MATAMNAGIMISDVQVTRFLQFSLNSQMTGLVALDSLIGVIELRSGEILPVPSVPRYLLGIANWRGNAVWLLDLAYRFGSPHLSERAIIPELGTAMLMQLGDQLIGLFVDRVSSIEVYDRQHLQPLSPEMVSTAVLPYLQGYFTDATGHMLLLVNTDAILQI
jgi:positive phototaxis protein PixI